MGWWNGIKVSSLLPFQHWKQNPIAHNITNCENKCGNWSLRSPLISKLSNLRILSFLLTILLDHILVLASKNAAPFYCLVQPILSNIIIVLLVFIADISCFLFSFSFLVTFLSSFGNSFIDDLSYTFGIILMMIIEYFLIHLFVLHLYSQYVYWNVLTSFLLPQSS